jgi:methylase of polypeptide subunit release factors
MIYPSIRIEGAILSPDIIDRLEELPGQKPADFGLDSGTKVKDEIARAWADAQDYWRIFQRKLDTLKPDATGTTETRNLWIVPLLGLLRYDLEFQKAGTEINGKNYAISHRVTNRGQTPLHIVGIRDPAGLDRKPANATLRMSAHAVVQEFLNLDEQLYGLVTNGRMLRLLRDSSRLIKQSYLEFDLERIFTDGLFADFAILYRLLHATRLPLSSEAAAESLIERYHQDSLDSGARIREGLSAAVENAILTFGNGFIAHPDNKNLRELLASGQLTADDYYKSLLRLIYRLLFLMVIEERGLVFPAKATQKQRDIYTRSYSVARLRGLAEKRYLSDKRQNDLWLALLSTFRLFEAGGPGEKLGLKPLAGDLFDAEALGELERCYLANDALLACLRSLGLYQHPISKQLIRVNYAALNVEEFGSVYEGLLEYEPAVDTGATPPSFSFKRGDERSATGSHYTPDDLVQPLIKHSLDHLIADRLTKPDPEKELLDLRVADIACGSGHILLAAARRIATELAIVRTGEEQPSPTAYRTALRDTIRTCIYGVDLNPLAVELCKVALWLEAHNPGEPLNFLDHRIKCGNAIVGYVRREEVDAGVPDEAFAKLPADDPEVAKKIRARNKSERKSRDQKKFAFTKDRQGQIDAVLDKWKTIAAMPERVPAEIDAKKDAFNAFMSSGAAFVLKQIASIPIAQFYLPRTKENEQKLITDEAFREYWSGNLSPQGQAPAAAVGVATKKRFFHWFLEFPEIVQRGGFDCILGNPPYLGGTSLSGKYGHEFCTYVKWIYAPAGLSDLVAYFVRRLYSLMRPDGFIAFLTTNSIQDGDIREDSIGYLVDSANAAINMATRNLRWPGRASLAVHLLAISRATHKVRCFLDGREVTLISKYLETNDLLADPLELQESGGRIYEGIKFLGDGFLLENTAAASLIRSDSRYAEVIHRFFDGDSVVNSPAHHPSRFIINFGDRSEEDASTYRLPFTIVLEKVKPVRDKDNRAVRRKYWWQFAEKSKSLTNYLASHEHAFAAVATAKYLGFVRFPADAVFAQALKVTATDRWDVFSVLQCAVHEVWARKFSGYLETRLRYSPSQCLETFAFPEGLWQTPLAGLADIGSRYHEHRRQLMLSLWLGLTDVYNLFHSRELDADLAKHFASREKKDPAGSSIPEEHRAGAVAFTLDAARAGIVELRRLHVELDTAVRDAYGWQDLPMEHDFYEVETLPENDRVRYTISPATRKELLKRLLAENHRRAAAESATQAQTPPSSKKATKRAKRSRAAESPSLFSDEA